VKFLARVEGDLLVARWCRLVRNGRRLALAARPRLALGELITVTLPGCPAPRDEAITAWLEHDYGERNVGVLRPQSFRPAVIADLLDAVNAHDHGDAARQFSADAVAAFARDRGGALLAEIRAELDGALRPAELAARVRRFAHIVGRSEAGPVLDELAALHDVEHLLGLEHAMARWIAAAASPRDAELGELARTLPDDDASAGISQPWFQWWWRLARACTRHDLMTIVDRAVELADEHCTTGRRAPIAPEARREARRMAERMREARTARLWSEPPDPAQLPTRVGGDPDDAHHAAFMAVSHAAHALAYALVGQLTAAGANRNAMQILAELAVRFLQDEPA
jgi:hypothetical protein